MEQRLREADQREKEARAERERAERERKLQLKFEAEQERLTAAAKHRDPESAVHHRTFKPTTHKKEVHTRGLTNPFALLGIDSDEERAELQEAATRSTSTKKGKQQKKAAVLALRLAHKEKETENVEAAARLVESGRHQRSDGERGRVRGGRGGYRGRGRGYKKRYQEAVGGNGQRPGQQTLADFLPKELQAGGGDGSKKDIKKTEKATTAPNVHDRTEDGTELFPALPGTQNRYRGCHGGYYY
jgi:hypothetical protein